MNVHTDAKTLQPGTAVDLTNCDREPIQFLNRVQPFGALVGVTGDWLVSHLSDNAAEFLGVEELALGVALDDIFAEATMKSLRAAMRGLTVPDATERRFGISVVPGGKLCDVAVHLSGRTVVIEFEHHDESEEDDLLGTVRPLIERLGETRNVEKLCKLATRHLAALTGFSRVMVYRFDDDESGTVVAETRASGLEPFEGLRYPASDIPKQARALYKRSLLRIISDAKDGGVPIRPDLDPEGQPLDLSMGATRAVSPIHLEYLANMGVAASMSISILQGDRLWGLFACHHHEPRVLSYRRRSALELFAQMFAFLVEGKENAAERQQRDAAQALHDRITVRVADGTSIADGFDDILEQLGDVVPHDGAVGWLDGEFRSTGLVPDREQFMEIAKFLNTTAAGRVYATDHLASKFPQAGEFADRAAGILALPVSRSPRDYIVLFRRPIAQTLTWAGNPEKPVEVGPNGARLTPRKSFAAFKQTVEGRSLAWSSAEIRTAEALRVTLLEVVLRVTEAAMKESRRAHDQQELLIAELNHRVRNILNLIKGLVRQSGSDEMGVTEFTGVIGGRINALARAHDLITRENWNSASLSELLRTEASAYVSTEKERLRIEGTDVNLAPAAFSVMALVAHELMTNAAKYGAFVDSSGHITVAMERASDGALVIDWAESGGPPVQAPKRRGFGTTIVERSVPFELRGEAELRYEMTGLRARFVIPNSYVSTAPGAAVRDEPAEETPKGGFELGHVLLVEDNMIIALDTEDALIDRGATDVTVSARVGDAIERIDGETFDVAVLDVNLGSETSERVAERLTERGVPFVFATGYGDRSSFSQTFPDVPVISKPYDADTLFNMLSQAADARASGGSGGDAAA